ncbi:MAG: GDSL-type esterase/lipase family protein [Candidatus Thorarchaeota archaeon]
MLLILAFLLSGIIFFHLIRKYYLTYNLLRLDPLEENIIDTESLLPDFDYNNIWLMGDSRIARWDTNLLSPLRSKISNLGIEGQTTSQVLNRCKNYLEIGQPQWIIIQVGINDLKIIGTKVEFASQITKGCFQNICSLIELCQDRNIKVILISVIPTGKIELLRRFIWNKVVDASILEVNKELENFCILNNILYFDIYNILCDKNNNIRKEYQDGFLHLNNEAYKILSKNLITKYGTIINSN